MKVPIRIARSVQTNVPPDRARRLLADYESLLRGFPKLRKLTRIADDTYLCELETIGSRTADIAYDVSYAARYDVDAESGVLRFTPHERHGNASIEGEFSLRPNGKGTELSFAVRGELRDVPVPLMYRLLAPPFIQGKFTRLVDVFLDNARARLG